jgi:hypothetical protein
MYLKLTAVNQLLFREVKKRFFGFFPGPFHSSDSSEGPATPTLSLHKK